MSVKPEQEKHFLDIASSVSGKAWCARDVSDRTVSALVQRFELPELVARVLAGRGVGMEDAEAFLSPTLKAFMGAPSDLRDLEKGAARLAAAITAGEGMAIR